MCIFHKWSKWEEYKRQVLVTPGVLAPKELRGKEYETVEWWQKRMCERCGYVQRRQVSE
jgi:hypothetical protein